MSRSQRGLSQSQVEEEVGDDVVNEVVKTLLALDATKRPVKRSDLLSGLSTKPGRKLMGSLWTKVRESLDELGMVLSELPASGAYMLIAKEPESEFMYKYLDKNERAERTLLILVLAYIFMKEGPVSEDELFKHLSNLKIIETTSVHEYFGDVKKRIKEQFVEQLYLKKHTEPGQEVAEYDWGPRALLEVPRMLILEFVCRIGYGGKMQPQNWVSHYEKATEEVEEEDTS